MDDDLKHAVESALKALEGKEMGCSLPDLNPTEPLFSS